MTDTLMEEEKQPAQSLIDQLKEYVETRIKLAKLQAIEGSSTVFASLITDALIAITIMLGFLFATFTLALYLGHVLGAHWMGFGCVAVLYLLVALIIRFNRKNFEKPIANAFIKKLFR